MRPKLKITSPGTHEEVRKVFDLEIDVKRRRKLHVVKLAFLGEYTTEEIAEIVGCSKPSVTNWVRKYRQGGVEGLLKTSYQSGRKPSLGVWDQVAVAYANRVYETLDEIEEDISEALRPFRESPKPVLSLLGVDNYLQRSANAS